MLKGLAPDWSLTTSPGRPISPEDRKSPGPRKSGIYDACGNSLQNKRPPMQRKSAASLDRKSKEDEVEVPKQKPEQLTRSKTVLRKPTFREVEEKLFPGKAAAANKNKLVKSQSLDSDCRPLSIPCRPQTPKWMDVGQTKPPAGKQQGKSLTRRAREVFLVPETFSEKAEHVVEKTCEESLAAKPVPFMKKFFHR